MEYSIIIPVYNSEHSIIELNNTLHDYFKTSSYEIIYVDDQSSDASYSLLASLANGDRHVKCIKLGKNYGQQKALFCGMFYASGDYIITMDDDLQHGIHYLDEMIDQIKGGKDLVYGVLPKARIHSLRSFGTYLRETFFRVNFKRLKSNRVSSFRIFKKALLLKAIECEYHFIYLSPLLLKESKNIGNVVIENNERKHGKSGYTIRKLAHLYLLLNLYYSKYSIDYFKRRSGIFLIDALINIEEVNGHKKDNDTRGWQLSVRGHQTLKRNGL